ncbi:uncharacterized protein HMPREF1541_05792 [Cyphellophora europaea CBS 101466]|uniref:Copper-fist domain-containing protein n=1 Tax=Cyphellophora europaea (strain CBS 101466) TaxID=1220924 RepID=W2RSS6_CYPE1|nr:uncharacterized protein HMPREF1541_05792 [Cyphellophora europaea CBS 101466]ETN39566.1 hypothetical protein HMPREF1541_05792 [Cyphellophora europaea CBS 101466]
MPPEHDPRQRTDRLPAISQCQHCRGQRKARSQHVNCQCGAANAHDKDNCPHGDGNSDSCCCSHTSKCTCAIKRDKTAQVVPEDGNQVLHPKDSPKPLAHIKNCHDNKPMVFTGNGHHKPAHKFNDAHHQLGSPYKIPSRANTVHHHGHLAQRSTDSLPLSKFARPHHESPLHHSITPRQIKSEHNSPQVGPTFIPTSIPNDFRLPEYDPNAYSYSPFTASTPGTQGNSRDELSIEEQFPDAFPIRFSQPEESQAPQNVDWSSYDFPGFGANDSMLMNNPGWASQAMPVASEQFGNLNLGVTPSSGDVTDVDEFGFSRPNQPQSMSGDGSTGVSSPGDGQLDTYRLSVEGTPQSNILASDNLNSLDIDDYLRQAQEETKRMAMQNQIRQPPATTRPQLSPESSQSAFSPEQVLPGPTFNSMHPYTVHEAQQRAHSADTGPQSTSKHSSTVPATSLAEDPSWSAAPEINPTLLLDDAQEDEDWIR